MSMSTNTLVNIFTTYSETVSERIELRLKEPFVVSEGNRVFARYEGDIQDELFEELLCA